MKEHFEYYFCAKNHHTTDTFEGAKGLLSLPISSEEVEIAIKKSNNN